MISSKKLISYLLVLLFIFSTSCIVISAPLEVTSDGQVSVDTQLNTPKINIGSVLHMTPSSSPPENPQEGDIYFTTTKELLLFANNKWTPIVAADASHGSKTLTSGSGTWTVPAGIYSIKVSLTGGGGGAQPVSEYIYANSTYVITVGIGGNGGVQIDQYIDVVPGQEISYSVGVGGIGGQHNFMTGLQRASGAGTNTYFGNITVTGGQGGIYTNIGTTSNGTSGTPVGTYPNGAYGMGGSGSNNIGAYPGFPEGDSGSPGIIYIEY